MHTDTGPGVVLDTPVVYTSPAADVDAGAEMHTLSFAVADNHLEPAPGSAQHTTSSSVLAPVASE